jgi:hypothetical protein
MDGRKKSFVAGGMQQTQGLARTASQMFFKQEKTEVPVIKRKIFLCQLLVFLAYFAGALAIVIMFFKEPPPVGAYANAYSLAEAGPANWGFDADGVTPCAFGGCTKSPTTPPPTSKAPTGP